MSLKLLLDHWHIHNPTSLGTPVQEALLLYAFEEAMDLLLDIQQGQNVDAHYTRAKELLDKYGYNNEKN